jgi:hypothetical protein
MQEPRERLSGCALPDEVLLQVLVSVVVAESSERWTPTLQHRQRQQQRCWINVVSTWGLPVAARIATNTAMIVRWWNATRGPATQWPSRQPFPFFDWSPWYVTAPWRLTAPWRPTDGPNAPLRTNPLAWLRAGQLTAVLNLVQADPSVQDADDLALTVLAAALFKGLLDVVDVAVEVLLARVRTRVRDRVTRRADPMLTAAVYMAFVAANRGVNGADGIAHFKRLVFACPIVAHEWQLRACSFGDVAFALEAAAALEPSGDRADGWWAAAMKCVVQLGSAEELRGLAGRGKGTVVESHRWTMLFTDAARRSLEMVQALVDVVGCPPRCRAPCLAQALDTPPFDGPAVVFDYLFETLVGGGQAGRPSVSPLRLRRRCVATSLAAAIARRRAATVAMLFAHPAYHAPECKAALATALQVQDVCSVRRLLDDGVPATYAAIYRGGLPLALRVDLLDALERQMRAAALAPGHNARAVKAILQIR